MSNQNKKNKTSTNTTYKFAEFLRGLGQEAHYSEGKEVLQRRIMETLQKQGVEMQGFPEGTNPVQDKSDPTPAADPAIEVEKRVRVIIHPADNELPFVFIGVNGRDIVIQREKEVCIPLSHMEVLRNSITKKVVMKPGEKTTTKDVPRFNYQEKGEVLTDKQGNPVKQAA